MPEIPEGFANVIIPALHTSGTRPAAVTFGVRNDLGALTPQNVADQVWDAFSTNVLPLLDDQVTWGPIHVQLGVSGGILSGDGADSSVGGAAIDSVSSNTAVLVRKGSLVPGRRGRGRYFWPWAAADNVVSELGIWGAASVANFQGGQEDFLDALGLEQLPMVILHSGAGTPALVSALSTQPLLATQRRRMRP